MMVVMMYDDVSDVEEENYDDDVILLTLLPFTISSLHLISSHHFFPNQSINHPSSQL